MIEKYVERIKLDFSDPSYNTRIHAKQGDRKSRFVEVTLTAGGTVYPIFGVCAVFRATKPDGNMVLNQAELTESGTVLIELTEQTLAVPGLVLADIQLVGTEGELLASCGFCIEVENAVTGIRTPSKSEFAVFNESVSRAETAAQSAETAAHLAEVSAAKIPIDVLKPENIDSSLTRPGMVADAEAVGQAIRAMKNALYPVGSIYMSTSDTSPQVLFGGVWVGITDRFLLASGTKAAGATGGEETHKLTISEMPRHKHYGGSRWGSSAGADFVMGSNGTGYGHEYDERSYAGNNMPHNNMPPYLVVHMWQRTA